MRPPRPILVFDGDCGFCTRCAVFIRRQIPTAAEIIPWQSADLEMMGLTQRQVEREVVWVDRDGRRAGGADGIAALLIDAGGWWAVVGHVLRTRPLRWLAHLSYRLIADNRHRLPGGSATCARLSDQPAADGAGGGPKGLGRS